MMRDPQCDPVLGYCPRCGGEMYHEPEEDEICEWCERELRIEASMREEEAWTERTLTSCCG